MLRVVIVDDAAPILKLMEKLIEKDEQAKVIGKFSLPSEAIEHIKKLKPDAVFLDIEMPGMNGIELAERLIEEDENLEIVFVTAYSQYALETFKVNALNYIMKPVSVKEISKTLLRISRYKNLATSIQRKEEFSIKCFGGFEVINASGIPVKWISKKSSELLAFFIMNRNCKMDKWKIGEALWPEASEQQVTRNFHTTLFRLRKILTEEGIPIKIRSEKGTREGYLCNIGELNCDVIKLEDYMLQNMTIDENNISKYESMKSNFKDELFEGLNYTWCSLEKENFSTYFIDVLENMTRYYINKGHYKQAFTTIKNSLKIYPYKEKTHQMLMEIYFYENDKISIIKHYEEFKLLLKQDLDTEPDLFTEQIYEKFLTKL